MIYKIFAFLKKILLRKDKIASLSIVGVGPGDASLLTLTALELIKKANVIAYPVSDLNKNSFSLGIISKYIRFKKKVPIIFPMANEGYEPGKIWENAANMISKYIKEKNAVVLICLGDPSIYASSSYVLRKIRKNYPNIKTTTIPGISSFSAAAALSNFDLVRHGEVLKIFECPNNIIELLDLLEFKKKYRRVLVIMKLGKRWKWVKKALKDEGLLNKTLIAINIGTNKQVIDYAENITNEELPYFSLLIIRI